MTLTPIASTTPARKLEAGDPNSAAILNAPAQSFLNQALSLSIELEAIAAIQGTIGQRIATLSDAISLKNGAIGLRDSLQSERSQSSTADVQATSVEAGITPLSDTTGTETARVQPLNVKLDGITPTTYQAFSGNLSAIAAAAASASNYLYRDPVGATTYATPQLSAGTKMRDVILQATIVAGAASPAIPNESEFGLPLVQTLNMASELVSWNASTKELTLGIGEYSIEGYVVATNTQLVQMLLMQGSTRYLGTAGKGTNESGVIGGDRLSIYSHLFASFKVTSARIYKPLIFLSSGSIVSSSLSLSNPSPWAFLRVRHYQ